MFNLINCLVLVCILIPFQARAVELDPAKFVHEFTEGVDVNASGIRDYYELNCTGVNTKIPEENFKIHGTLSAITGNNAKIGIKSPVLNTDFVAIVNLDLKYGAGEQSSWDLSIKNEADSSKDVESKVFLPLHSDGNDRAILVHKDGNYGVTLTCNIKPITLSI